MPKNTVVPIETAVGVLHGRDCIYIKTVKQDRLDHLIFRGELNGGLIVQKHRPRKWIPFQLVFHQVIAYFCCELDTYENVAGTNYLDDSDFDLMPNGKWLESFPIRTDFDKQKYHHYRVVTYDFVYNILAVSYRMEIEK